MPIDPRFKTNRTRMGLHRGVIVWGPIDSPRKIGIHGSTVAVDLDLCFGCLKCIEVCTVNVFDKLQTPQHPISVIKVEPIRENDCFFCLACELVCPVDAILIDRGPSQGETLQALLNS